MRSDRLFLLAALGGFATLGAALYFQYVEGLHPCKLCIWQRYALAVGIGGALLGWLIGGGGLALAAGGLGAAGYLAESGIAVYHSGVERKWWAGPDTCSGGGGMAGSFDPASLTQSLAQGAVPQCDEIVWDFLGLSMANWNVLLAAGLAGICFLGLRRGHSSSSVSQ